MIRKRAALVAFFLVALAPAPARAVDLPPGQAVFDPFQVLTLNLELAPANWDTIRRDTTDTIEVPAQFWADGETPILVSVRRKTSRALPSESNPVKVGLKVDINEFVDGQKWHDLNKVSLENGTDSGVLAEGLAWNMHRMASTTAGYGYLSAQAAWVRMVVNGQYIGVYLNAEQRDKQMLKNRGVWVGDKTWLYDQHDMSTIELEEGIGHSSTFLALCYSPFSNLSRKNGGCATPGDAVLTQQLNSLINMQGMLAECAVDALSGNDDSLCRHGHNFQFADWAPDVGRKRMYFPWDLDQVFGKASANIYANGGGRKPSMNAFQEVILRNPTFRAQYNGIMAGLIGGPLSESELHAFLDALEPVLSPALATDPYPTVSSGTAPFNALKSWVSQRLPIVQAQLAANNSPPPR
jgi:spore coat protein CotH